VLGSAASAGGRGIAAEIHRHLVDFVQHETGFWCWPSSSSDDLAGQRADIRGGGATRLRHAPPSGVRRLSAAGRLGDRHASGLTDAGRSDEAQDRTLDFDQAAYRQIQEYDPDLFKTVVIGSTPARHRELAGAFDFFFRVAGASRDICGVDSADMGGMFSGASIRHRFFKRVLGHASELVCACEVRRFHSFAMTQLFWMALIFVEVVFFRARSIWRFTRP
jgi:hypothetical protein